MASAATSAATPAAQPVYDPGWSVNDPAGYPAAEHWPGALESDHADDNSAESLAGGGNYPVNTEGSEPFASGLPQNAEGGGYIDTVYLYGHDGPSAAWDSSFFQPFAPSGPVPPELHGDDTGGVYQKEHVIPAGVGTYSRRDGAEQTTIKIAPTLETIGQYGVNERIAHDLYQYHDPGGTEPYTTPYSERPLYNNLAYEAVPLTASTNSYMPAGGSLPDRSVYDLGGAVYEAPPDPNVSAAVPVSASDFGEAY